MSGILVALALIPEAIAFSIIAGVDPMVGLYAAFCIAVVIAFIGGRPGMISGATGAMALLMVTLVADHGLQYLFAATILTGFIQLIMGVLKLGKLMRFIPNSVMIGFVNALAILIFMAQLEQFEGAGWTMYALVAVSLAIIYLVPRFFKAIPSPLIAIIVVTGFVMATGVGTKTVGDMGTISQTLPSFLIPNVPFTLETLMIILPYSISLAVVGLLESLLTAQIVDDMTDTPSDKNKEARGQGIANMITGCFGGMAGCAMIGQAVINVKSGGRGRLSSFTAGAVLLGLIMVLTDVVVQIPMAVLVGVMIMVSIGTFDWGSLTRLHKVPRTDAAVMIVTVATVVITHDLSKGVLAGVLLSAIFFAAKISKVHIDKEIDEAASQITYRVEGQIFFASVTDFVSEIDFDPQGMDTVVLDFTKAHLWDDSAINAVDKVAIKIQQNGAEVKLTGLNKESNELVDQLSVYDQPDAKVSGH
ncbi:SulP family inorganic anion transporter [Jeotgalibacillus sp. HH7-29]|uniref:SulP family inorganic anion transporter n=1 Tax=Jeotgalibacillus haloalkalitolerans TaxID=3104292 RepID=A0ABU5KPJ6_9BACL|nr:SulP family inorganic anion transporter [Jeotgalibacillus sp. HH7-29]MDZ5713110.1 SulP family inorganic anion transporter [Jeotgalibacillus sp. HH7-29]